MQFLLRVGLVCIRIDIKVWIVPSANPRQPEIILICNCLGQGLLEKLTEHSTDSHFITCPYGEDTNYMCEAQCGLPFKTNKSLCSTTTKIPLPSKTSYYKVFLADYLVVELPKYWHFWQITDFDPLEYYLEAIHLAFRNFFTTWKFKKLLK